MGKLPKNEESMKLTIKKGVIAGIAVAFATTAIAAGIGNKPVYVLSTNSAVELEPIATTGDKIGGYVVRGIPDGMGAFANSQGGITILSNHEVATNDAIAKKSASTTSTWGTTITKFNYSPNGRTITSASNLFNNVNFWNYNTNSYQSTPIGGEPKNTAKDSFGWGISRFCSATFSPAGTFMYNGVGYDGALFTTGEEVGDSSRGFAFDMNGNGWQLPRMGMLSFETISPTRKPGINTVAIGNEDGSATDSQLHLYIGKKQNTGRAVDKAGLTNGDLYVLNAGSIPTDNIFRTTIAKSTPVDVNFKKIEWNTDVTSFAKGARENGMTFARIEDGEWDPKNPDVYYFITTESNKDPVATKENPNEPGVSRDGGALWRLTFKDAQNPLLGAKLEMLLNGGETPYLSKPDNMTVTKNGVIMIQEDPGNNAHVARILAYQISTGKLVPVAEFDKQYFTAAGSNFMTLDEESSGIIDVTDLLAKPGDTNTYFFFNAQVHTYSGVTAKDTGVKGALQPARPDLINYSKTTKNDLNLKTVEGGQYYRMTVTDWNQIFG
ncbi:MAG: hypothetical protein RL581_1131 [Actinomycetota bacterium]